MTRRTPARRVHLPYPVRSFYTDEGQDMTANSNILL